MRRRGVGMFTLIKMTREIHEVRGSSSESKAFTCQSEGLEMVVADRMCLD
jgi:hypothetical protein